ncbi:hypothetical protein HYV50_04715 [Candidatus Pacearchaeota archaeon]|nr:hypothetical protein [Candidatus Pacearchaeota archaeon]
MPLNNELDFGLGDLVRKMQEIVCLDPLILSDSKDKLPKRSLDNYQRYIAIVQEINSREQSYLLSHPAVQRAINTNRSFA